MWELLQLPKIKSTIRACALPDLSGGMAIWTDEGVFQVRLDPSPALLRLYTVKEAIKVFNSKRHCFFKNNVRFSMHGDCGPHGWKTVRNLQTYVPLGYKVEIDDEQNRVLLFDTIGNVCLTVDSVRVKDRMLIANFCINQTKRGISSYFVVCDSKSLRVYVYRPIPEDLRPRWNVSGSRESQQSLWNAIIENPDDDTPRLIYADWLEENDDRERAEFIRLQCRIAERVEQEFIPKDDPDRLLNQKMRNQFGDRWVKEISEIKGIGFHNEFWRGFPICEITDAHLASQKSQARKILATSPLDFIAFNVTQEADIERLEKWELTSRGRNIIFLTKYMKQIPLYARLLKSKQLAGVKSVYFQGLFGPGLNLALTKSGRFY